MLCVGFSVEHEAVWPSDVHRFQLSAAQIESIDRLAYEQKIWCENQLDLEPWQRVAESIEFRFAAWAHLHALKSVPDMGAESVVWRLHELRELIGRDNYFRGIMPDCRIVQAR